MKFVVCGRSGDPVLRAGSNKARLIAAGGRAREGVTSAAPSRRKA
jgi:hypothetical protein